MTETTLPVAVPDNSARKAVVTLAKTLAIKVAMGIVVTVVVSLAADAILDAINGSKDEA